MSILIRGITLDDFIQYGGEYAAYLDGTGCTEELPDHGDLIDRDVLLSKVQKWYWEALETVKRMTAVIPAERSE